MNASKNFSQVAHQRVRSLLTFDFWFVVTALAGRTAKAATTNLFLIEPKVFSSGYYKVNSEMNEVLLWKF